jgi:hypothetical protein
MKRIQAKDLCLLTGSADLVEVRDINAGVASVQPIGSNAKLRATRAELQLVGRHITGGAKVENAAWDQLTAHQIVQLAEWMVA